MVSKKSQAIGFRIEKSLKETIGQIAKKETRTVSQQVEHFVKQGIAKYREENPEVGIENNDREVELNTRQP